MLTRTRPTLVRAITACGLLLAPSAPAQDAPPPPARPDVDPVTLRDLRNFPPDVRVRYHHMRLDVSIADMNVARLDAVQTLTFAPIAYTLERLTLDAKLMDIASVRVSGEPAVTTAFDHDGERLTVSFTPPLEVGVPRDLVTTYTVNDPPLGLIWTPESPAWPGRAAQVHTQGESIDSSYWFPCHDFPNARLTTELVATVPEGYIVSSNGRLVSEGPESELLTTRGGAVIAAPSASPRRRFHWLQDTPHVNYLVSLVVGKFDVVDVGSRKLPMPVYVPPGRGRDVERTYARTLRMVALFERLFDEPYPWDRYAQVLVWNFAAAGMENTSATTLFDTAVLSPEGAADSDLDGLISHELAHQWFSDLLTCRSWEHIWLNEGFATYAEALWEESRGGFEGYQARMLSNVDDVVKRDRGTAPHVPGMVSKVYSHPDDVFGRDADPYPKGAAVLHMLRVRVGDEAFFRALGAYVDRFKFNAVETGDVRRTFEDATGENLERYFTQWCERPGIPRLDATSSWEAATRQLTVAVRQTQVIDGDNPAFAFRLPIWARCGSTMERVFLDMDTRDVSGVFVLPSEPSFVAVDPEIAVLAEISLSQPARWLTEQLLHGPTLAARVQGARALANDRSAEASLALWAVFDDDRQHSSLRRAAIEALSRRPGATWVDDLAAAHVRDPRVREAAINAVAEAASRSEPFPTVLLKARPFLAREAEDKGELVRAAAVRGLGRIKSIDHLPLLVAAAGTDSQHDRVRRAAIDALADLDRPEGLPSVVRLSAPGVLNDTRATAVGAIARLAHHDPEAAYSALETLLWDRERNVWTAAGGALARTRDARASVALASLRERKPAPIDQRLITGWLDQLAEGAALAPRP
ncbi:MAG: M1 family aminopeptidase [Phycisphaerales bacterium]